MSKQQFVIIAYLKEKRDVVYLNDKGEWGNREGAFVFNERQQAELLLRMVIKNDNTVTVASLFAADDQG